MSGWYGDEGTCQYDAPSVSPYGTVIDMDTTTMTPVEVDTELYRIYMRAMTIEGRITGEVKTIERLAARADKAPLTAWDQKNYEQAKARLAEYQAERLALITEKAPFEVEYMSRPWARYFLVTNGNGHVHRGMDCRTCFITTQYAWVVDLADCDEAKMVEEYGEKACTICFPNAPALPAFNSPGRRDREVIEARAAEKAARADAKAAKLLNEPLRLQRHSWTIETVAAAKQAIRDNIYDMINNGYSKVLEDCKADNEALIAALLAKGIEQADIDTIIARATKKARSGR